MLKKKLFKNTSAALIFQITTIICGFVMPKLILEKFGSEVNGLINSITQFLSVIAFLELGVGAVVQSSLYKPLAQKNEDEISKIVVSAEKFFRRLAIFLTIYIIIIIFIYPYITKQSFIYTSVLILAMGINSFSQYYFGIVNRLLLTADQKSYIHYNVQTVTLILNTCVCVILINIGASIHIVKFTTSFIYLLRPFLLRVYVDKNYNIDRNIKYENEPIKQKWNGVAQHIAAIVLDGTDLIVLTIFASLSDVSIYSIYHLVVSGVKQLFTSMLSGIQSFMGALWAKQEQDKLFNYFSWIEWIVHTSTIFVWGCTLILIVPFVEVYTKEINDVNYKVPLFAILITLANAMHCLRLPYNIMILAAGHYKQTQHNYIIAAIINIVISIITVKKWGLIGVAIGTLIAMFYQTIWMSIYNTKNLIKHSFTSFIKQILVDSLSIFIIILCTIFIVLDELTYFAWVIMAGKVMLVLIVVIILLNFIFYREKIILLINNYK